MLLGPSLDVLEEPNPESTGDLGIRTFGGDPFWVGRMGQMYITGVHSGSGGNIAVIAKHFLGWAQPIAQLMKSRQPLSARGPAEATGFSSFHLVAQSAEPWPVPTECWCRTCAFAALRAAGSSPPVQSASTASCFSGCLLCRNLPRGVRGEA